MKAFRFIINWKYFVNIHATWKPRWNPHVINKSLLRDFTWHQRRSRSARIKATRDDVITFTSYEWEEIWLILGTFSDARKVSHSSDVGSREGLIKRENQSPQWCHRLEIWRRSDDSKTANKNLMNGVFIDGWGSWSVSHIRIFKFFVRACRIASRMFHVGDQSLTNAANGNWMNKFRTKRIPSFDRPRACSDDEDGWIYFNYFWIEPHWHYYALCSSTIDANQIRRGPSHALTAFNKTLRRHVTELFCAQFPSWIRINVSGNISVDAANFDIVIEIDFRRGRVHEY